MGIWIVVVLALLAAMALSGRFTARYATERGRSKRAWFILGALLFPLFPLPQMVLQLLPRK
jgi:hypothetical protein